MSPQRRALINTIRLAAIACCAIGLFCFNCAAQTTRDSLPRVGTIKDYPATGLMTGCGNLYFYPAPQTNPAGDAYVFISRGDGSNAWMNLNGRDVRLRQLKPRASQKLRPYYYRSGTLRITVLIEPFKPANAPVADNDPMMKMKITLRKGRSRRILLATGDSDC